MWGIVMQQFGEIRSRGGGRETRRNKKKPWREPYRGGEDGSGEEADGKQKRKTVLRQITE